MNEDLTIEEFDELDDFNEVSNELDFNMEDFGEEFEISEKFESRYIKPPKSKELSERRLKYSLAKDLALGVDLSERTYVIVNGMFIFGDFIEALIIEKGLKVKSMTISTLSMSCENIDSLDTLLDCGFVDELNLIVSDYFYSHERHGLVKYIYETLDKDNKFQFAAAGSHTKIIMFETYCGKHIVIHGSANLRSSSNIEQIMIENNLELYNFNKEYHDRILEKYKTINKSVRYSNLWNCIKND
jgi:hypothetical protein